MSHGPGSYLRRWSRTARFHSLVARRGAHRLRQNFSRLSTPRSARRLQTWITSRLSRGDDMAGTADEKSTSKRWNWRIPVPERFRRSAAANPKGTATGEGAGGRSRSGEAAAPRTPRKSIREQFAASKGMAWKFAAATALLSVLLVVYHSFRGPRHHRHSPVDQQGVANNDQGAEVKIVHAGDSPDSHALDSHSTSSGGADPAAAPPQSADQATVAASDPMSLPADKNSAPSDPSHAEPFHRHHSGGHDAKKGDDAPVLTTSNDPPLQNDPLSQSPSGAGSGASGAGSLTNNSSTPARAPPSASPLGGHDRRHRDRGVQLRQRAWRPAPPRRRDMSYFIFSMPSAGLIETPPVSKVTPLPISARWSVPSDEVAGL